MHRIRAAQVALLSAMTLLAGCSGGDDGTTQAPATEVTSAPLEEGKGGILGLVIDDVYRPVPGALVLIETFGLTATTDGAGQFAFRGLEPGTYVLLVSAEAHEATPTNLDVQAGQYAETEIVARRIFSQDGTIITTQYSVFVPCSVSAVAATETANCMGDLSGDSYRAGFDADYTAYGENVTYLVTEMKANHKASSQSGAFKVVVREAGNGDYWGSKFTVDGDYIKITMRLGNVSADDTEARNVEWRNDKRMETILFPQGGAKSESQGALDTGCGLGIPTGPTCFESRGVGPQAGVKANFVQSLFLGEPKDPIESYNVFSAE